MLTATSAFIQAPYTSVGRVLDIHTFVEYDTVTSSSDMNIGSVDTIVQYDTVTNSSNINIGSVDNILIHS